jgi:hypothetical protein
MSNWTITVFAVLGEDDALRGLAAADFADLV